MAGTHPIRALVVDDEPCLIDDYACILAPRSESGGDRLFAKLEADLFGPAVRHRKFPEIDLATFSQGRDAVEAVRLAVAEDRPFTVAFIDLYLSPGLDGLQTAEQVRALDPNVYIVLVSAHSNIHPVDMCERVPPADQLFFLKKPFHTFEIQQLILSLTARWRAEHMFSGSARAGAGGVGSGRSGLAETLERLPAGVVVFDRRDRLLSVNEEMAKLFPELADLFVFGTPYEEIQRQMALRLLPESTLVRVDPWVSDRMEWHARSGRVLEQKLRGPRWVLLVEGSVPSGETYCMYNDITDLKRRELSRATAAHMTQMAQSFAALCEQLDVSPRGARPEHRSGVADRDFGSDVAVLPGGMAGPSGVANVQTVADKLEAIAQRQRLAPEAVGLNRLIGQLVRQMRGAFPPAVDAEIIAGAGLWPVLVDKAKFGVTLSELIRNACDVMTGGGRLTLETANIRLTKEFVATRAGLVAGEYVLVSVQDSGPGMSPDLAERALNPFFTSKGGDGHLGLGLSVAYGFASQSGGYIDIDGGEGRGTTVDLYFPRAEGVAAEPVVDDTSEAIRTDRSLGSAAKGRA